MLMMTKPDRPSVESRFQWKGSKEVVWSVTNLSHMASVLVNPRPDTE